MESIDPDRDLLSTGKLAEVLQASPRELEQAAGRAGVRPALRLNGVPYFTDSAVDKIRKRLRQKVKGAKS